MDVQTMSRFVSRAGSPCCRELEIGTGLTELKSALVREASLLGGRGFGWNFSIADDVPFLLKVLAPS